MTLESKPQPIVVSEVPLEAAKPPSGRLAFVVLIGFIALGLGCAAWVVHEVATAKPRPVFEPGPPLQEEQVPAADKEASLAKMKEISAALLSYRDRMGGGLRFPDSLEELTEVEFLPRGYDFRGALSRRPIVYRPEMPPAQDPALWVLAHDRLLGRRANPRGYGFSQGLIGAVVLFADGNVRFLDDKEVAQFGGLNEPPAAR